MSHQMQQMAEHAKEHIKESKLEVSTCVVFVLVLCFVIGVFVCLDKFGCDFLQLSHQMKQMAEHAKEHIKRSKLEVTNLVLYFESVTDVL